MRSTARINHTHFAKACQMFTAEGERTPEERVYILHVFEQFRELVSDVLTLAQDRYQK